MGRSNSLLAAGGTYHEAFHYSVNYESCNTDEEARRLIFAVHAAKFTCSKIQLTVISPPRTLNPQKR